MSTVRPSFTDPSLPHLPALLDTNVLADHLSGYDAGLAAALRSATLVNARYKPGRRCLVGYRLSDAGLAERLPDSALPLPPMLTVTTYADGLGRRAVRATQSWPQHALPLPALDAVAWRFPADRKLSALPQLTCRDSVAAILRRNRDQGRNLSALQITDMTCMHYLPEHAYTVRVLAADGEQHAQVLFGKCSYDGRGAYTASLMRQLAGRAHGFASAALLAYDAPSLSLWQHGLPIARRATLRELTPALMALHRTALPAARVRPAEHAAQALRSAQHAISHVFPELTCLAAQVHARLRRAEPRNGSVAATLHGDLHPGNYFISAHERLAFVDLDDVHCGAAAADLGSLLAHGINQTLGEGGDAQCTFEVLVDQLREYRDPSGNTLQPATLHYYTAHALFAERAKRCLTRLKLRQPNQVRQLLEVARDLLN